MLIFFFGTSGISEAQINPFKKIKRKVEQKVDKKIDESLESKEKKEKQPKEESPEASTEEQQQAAGDVPAESGEQEDYALTWAKYDFVPGEKVFFEDDLAGEENGEFPSRWDIYSGNVENARLGAYNVIMFREASFIMPYMDNAKSDYLPDIFTLEFDAFFNKGENYQGYVILFYDKLNQKRVDASDLKVYWNKAVMGRFEGWYPGVSTSANSKMEGWRHVAISFNRRALKLYLDDSRVLNIPNLRINPTGISIFGDYNKYNQKHGYIKNIRLAEGGVKLYDKMMQDGKIVATGIRFDVGKATLKPESMGIINNIVEMMKEHPELKFSIEGHTDSDGDNEFNQKLSEDRAMTVKNKLVERGISPERLGSKGFGETTPVDQNNTAEGKANNRRVEFVKI